MPGPSQSPVGFISLRDAYASSRHRKVTAERGETAAGIVGLKVVPLVPLVTTVGHSPGYSIDIVGVSSHIAKAAAGHHREPAARHWKVTARARVTGHPG